MADPDGIVGRGNRDGAALFRDWFDGLTEVAENDGKAAYVFVMGSLNEVLKSFDLPVVFPEINSLQTAVRRVAHEYLNVAEDARLLPDICGYVKADIRHAATGQGEHPMGKIPKPALAVYTNACNTYIKWAEIWERTLQDPIFTIDVPGTRQAGTARPGRATPISRTTTATSRPSSSELIELCEKVTGKSFDIDKMREVMGHANTMSRGWKRYWS